MAEAIFGLMGVVVGAGITGALEWLQLRRTRAYSRRAAIRLVGAELLTARATLEAVADADSDEQARHDLQDAVTGGFAAVAAWEQHRNVLAEELADDQWDDVVRAYVAFNLVTQVRSTEFDDLRSITRGAADAVGAALKAISAPTAFGPADDDGA